MLQQVTDLEVGTTTIIKLLMVVEGVSGESSGNSRGRAGEYGTGSKCSCKGPNGEAMSFSPVPIGVAALLGT